MDIEPQLTELEGLAEDYSFPRLTEIAQEIRDQIAIPSPTQPALQETG